MNFVFHSYKFYLHFDVFWFWSQVYIRRTELTRALEGGLRITPSGGGGGGAYNAPPIDLSSYES